MICRLLLGGHLLIADQKATRGLGRARSGSVAQMQDWRS